MTTDLARTPDVADLIAALPEGMDQPPMQTDELASYLARLALRPIPTGRLSRFWILSSLQAKVAAAYLAWWLRKGFVSKEKAAAALNETHLKAALELLGSMSYLRGAVMKMGQTLATLPNVVPQEFAEALKVLHFEAPPMHFSLLRELVHSELGGEVEDLFAEFDTKAFAAASLGQVHRARLHDGREVAVKIQYPNIARSIHADLANMAALLTPMRLTGGWANLREQFDDIRTMLDQEMDYVQEAAMQERARALFDESDRIVVPAVHHELSSERVLTTDLLVGQHLPAFLADQPTQADRDHFGQLLVNSTFRLMYRGEMCYADPHPGNYLFLDDGRLGLLDFGCIRMLDGDLAEYTLLAGRAMREGGATMDDLVAQSTNSKDVSELTQDHRQLVIDFCDWLWQPMRHTGPFDFGDPSYFQRGVDLTTELMRKRYTQSRPVNTWFNRLFYGARAMLHHLGARADMRAAEERECSLGPVSPE